MADGKDNVPDGASGHRNMYSSDVPVFMDSTLQKVLNLIRERRLTKVKDSSNLKNRQRMIQTLTFYGYNVMGHGGDCICYLCSDQLETCFMLIFC